MNELVLFVKQLGTPLGLLCFILYKEIPLFLKKRNGQWIDLISLSDSIKEVKSLFNNLKLDSINISEELHVYRSGQEQIIIAIQKDLNLMSTKIDKVYDLILNNGKK